MPAARNLSTSARGYAPASTAAGIIGIVYAIIEEPADGWHAQVLASLLGGMMPIGLFALRQRTSAAPLIDLQLFRNRLFSWAPPRSPSSASP